MILLMSRLPGSHSKSAGRRPEQRCSLNLVNDGQTPQPCESRLDHDTAGGPGTKSVSFLSHFQHQIRFPASRATAQIRCPEESSMRRPLVADSSVVN